jgi:hypothetical protein
VRRRFSFAVLVHADERIGLVVERILERNHNHLQVIAMATRTENRQTRNAEKESQQAYSTRELALQSATRASSYC